MTKQRDLETEVELQRALEEAISAFVENGMPPAEAWKRANAILQEAIRDFQQETPLTLIKGGKVE